jgi:ribose transport system ATP-binding protein
MMATTEATGSALLQIEGLSKSFGPVRALEQVSLQVHPGEIHGLLGQNGSGKSTLIKILSGYHAPDTGQVYVRGKQVPLPMRSTRTQDLGIRFVHQDLGLIESLPVLDNLRVSRYRAGPLGFISWSAERAAATETLQQFGVVISLDAKVVLLRDVDRAVVAIVRALQDLNGNAEKGLLVLDEPTVYLPRDGVNRLFKLMRSVADRGHGILFVSHQLAEVEKITDRVTVLRDGNP